MNPTRGTQITCPNCHQPFSAILEQIIDAGRDPQAKARLLSGRTNLVSCPHCGYQTVLSTPIIYHDPSKQLLITHVPMELGLPQREQEKLIGNLQNAVVNSLPPDQRKGYLLNPKSALTLQGLVEMVLEADGITPDVLEKQREKMRLVETFMQTDPEQLPELVQQYDDQLDMEFFAMLTAATEAALANGRRDMAEQILGLRDRLLELSTTGQRALQSAEAQEEAIREVAEALNNLGENATQSDLVDLVLNIAAEGISTDTEMGGTSLADEKIRALVGLARPALDYEFFQELTNRAEQAEGEEQNLINAVRDLLVQLTQIVDQQNEKMIRQAAETLRAIASSPDIDAAVRERVELVDDTFLAVLSANIQNAEQNKDIATAARLKMIFDKVVSILQESAPPAVRFINELMQQQSFEDAQAKLAEGLNEYGDELIQWMDMLSQDLAQRGGSSSPAFDRLLHLREEAAKMLTDQQQGQSKDKQANRPQLSVLRNKPRQ